MVESPCVGICKIKIKDGRCIGCLRTEYEIANWWEMSDYEKQTVLNRLLNDQLNKNSSRYDF